MWRLKDLRLVGRGEWITVLGCRVDELPVPPHLGVPLVASRFFEVEEIMAHAVVVLKAHPGILSAGNAPAEVHRIWRDRLLDDQRSDTYAAVKAALLFGALEPGCREQFCKANQLSEPLLRNACAEASHIVRCLRIRSDGHISRVPTADDLRDAWPVVISLLRIGFRDNLASCSSPGAHPSKVRVLCQEWRRQGPYCERFIF